MTIQDEASVTDGPEIRPSPEALLRPEAAARHLGVKRGHLRMLRKRRGLPVVRVGHRTLRYRLADLDQWIASQREQQAQPQPEEQAA